MDPLDRQLAKIRKAYDMTVEQYQQGVDPLDLVPKDIANLPGYREIVSNKNTSSGARDIKQYLKPKKKSRFLDAGCCANLLLHRLDKWPCTYYGVDISNSLISAMKTFVEKKRISIGGLYNTDLANLPFEDDFFDIASVIGVLEYCSLSYTERTLHELFRVLKPEAKMVIDIPNLAHPYVDTMFKLEEYLGRPNIPKSRSVFERMLASSFMTIRIDDSQVMVKYFVRKGK